jgi:hypothetical protein
VTGHIHPTIMPTHARKPVEHPLLPGEAKGILSLIAFLFGSSGVLFLLAVVVLLGGKAAGAEWVPEVAVSPLRAVIMCLVAIGYLATARLLTERRRLGGMLGFAFIGLSIVGEVISPDPIGAVDVLWPAGLLVALAFSWTHLTDTGSPPPKF